MSVTEELAWATMHALERGAAWGPTCECDVPFVVEDQDDDMPARCLLCGRREPLHVVR